MADTRLQLGSHHLELGHRRTGRLPWRGVACQPHRGVAVVAHRLHLADDPVGAGKGAQGHRLALRIDHIQPQQILRLHACGSFSLHDHSLQASLVGKVADIGRTQLGRQDRSNAVKADAQGIGLVAVDVQLQLRRIFQAIGSHANDQLALCGHAQHLIARIQQGLMPETGAVLQPQGKTGRIAELEDGRRAQGVDRGVANTHEGAEGSPGQCASAVLCAMALIPGLERRERDRGILPLARKRVADDRDDILYLRLLEHEVLDLLDHGFGAVCRRTWWQLHIDDQIALVLIGQEGSRQPHIEQRHSHQHSQIDQHHAAAAFEQLGDPTLIGFGGARETAVEPAEKSFLAMLLTCVDRLEQSHAKRWRQGQGHQR